MLDLTIYLFAGAVAGLTAGLFGVGGGLVVVPVLLLVFAVQGVEPTVATHLAIGTSMATVLITGASSAYSHYRLGAVDFPVFLRLAAGMALGGIIGALAAGLLPGDTLQRIFGLFLFSVSAYLLSGWQPPRQDRRGNGDLPVAGTAIGTLSGMMGVSGGTMTVPYLVWRGLLMHRAVGTSALGALPLGLVGTATYLAVGWGHPDLPGKATGYVYWPAFFGIVAASAVVSRYAARLAHRVPARRLRQLFAGFLMLVALRLLLT